MTGSVKEIACAYNPRPSLAEASTPSSSWYIDPRILEREQQAVFSRSWQYINTEFALSERIQIEDAAICESVQRGLGSRACTTGRLSARREAGEQLFHQLLHADLQAGLLNEGSA